MKNFLRLTTCALVLGAAISANAHRAWIIPAATVLSSDDPWVTFDAAISNDIFHADYRAMGLNGISVMAPDGSKLDLQNKHTGKYRSNFDLNLKQRGTYKIYSAQSNLRARWETETGQRRSYPGRGEQFTEEGFATKVPKQAKNLQISQGSRRLETFVTAGIPDEAALKPTNTGLEMVPVTHPNDLYAEETAEFKFIIDGEPAIGVNIVVLAGGMRYRNSQNEIKVKTDNNGMASITWPQAGMYYLEAEYADNKTKAPATSRRGSYVATFEVLPQ